MGGNRWKHLIYADITGRRVRAFPLLREFGDAKAQHHAYNHAQRTVIRKHQAAVLMIVWSSLAGGSVARFGPAPSLAALVVLLFLSIWLHRKSRVLIEAELEAYLLERATRCHACGYNLIGNQSGRCPECGTAFSDEHRRLISRWAELSDANLNPPPPATDNDDSGRDAAPGGLLHEHHRDHRTPPRSPTGQ